MDACRLKLLPDDRRMLLLAALAASVAGGIAIVALDGPLAVSLASLSPEVRHGIQTLTGVWEVLFVFGVSPYLYGGVLVAAGLAMLPNRKSKPLSRALLFVGLSHVTARFLADILKPPFSRLRPFEALAPDGWHDTWFAAVGNSFPSGHAVHFWSLFFPLAVLFPRWWTLLLVPPVIVSAARVAVNDHYASDVFASAAIAALVTWGYAVALLDRGLKK